MNNNNLHLCWIPVLFFLGIFSGLNAQSCTGSIFSSQSYACVGDVITYAYVPDSPPFSANTSFFWTVGTYGTILSGQGTDSLIVEWSFPYGVAPNPGDFRVSIDAFDNVNFCNWSDYYDQGFGSIPSSEGLNGSTNSYLGDTSWYFTRIFDGVNSFPSTTVDVIGGTIVAQGNAVMSPGIYHWTGYTYGIVWDSAGTAQVIYTYCDQTNFGCCFADTLEVQVAPSGNVDAPINGPEMVCEYDTATYSTPNDPGFSYLWIVSGGTILSGQNTPQVEVDWNDGFDSESGIVMLVKTGMGLGTSAVKQVATTATALVTPYLQILYGPNQVCRGTTREYYASMQMENYNWAASGGTILSGQGTDTVLVQWPSFGTGPGSIQVSGSISSNSFCYFPNVLRIVPVNFSPSSLIYPQVLSSPTSLINSTVTYSTPSNPGHTYTWSVTGGTIVSGQGSNQVDVLWTSQGAQTLDITETSPSCGPSTQSIPVNVTGYSVNISATDTTIYAYGTNSNCTQLTANLNPVPSNPTYSWSNGATTPSITVCPTTTTTYSVTVTDPGAGTQSNGFTVTVLPVPTCNGGTGVQICRSFGQFTFNQCVPPFSVANYLAQGATLGPCPNKSGQEDLLPTGPGMQFQPKPWSNQGLLTVTLPATQNAFILLFNAQGQEIGRLFEGKVEVGETQLKMMRNDLVAGLYFIRMETEQFGTFTEKVLVQ